MRIGRRGGTLKARNKDVSFVVVVLTREAPFFENCRRVSCAVFIGMY